MTSPKYNFPSVPLQDVPPSDSNTGSDSNRPMVLVVDDESSIADTLAEILIRSGYSAVPSYDADSALEIALMRPPAMLVSDVVLPGMSGVDLAISIRRIFPDCKVLLFSGNASTAGLLAEAHREGHQFVLLSKPVHPADLLVRIAEGIKSGQQQPVAAE